ncbi:hypothetical protein [Saccharopolyspora antimicrobica]|nr:hypothetical protein [Saccharopolyspora antimicrobica]
MRVVVLLLFLVGALVSGCGREAPPAVGEALAFSGVVVPPGGEVLGVDASRGIDSFCKVAVAVDAGSVERLLADSQFRAPLEPGREVTYEPLPQASIGTDFASASDELSPGPGRPNTVFRELLVDRSDPARPVVHIWAFTT